LTCPCQQLVNDTLQNHRVHYHAVIDKPPAIEILEEFEGRKGFFLKKYLIGAEYNMNQWRTPWEAIKQDVWDFKGKPIVLTPDRDHPPVYMQDDYKIGEIIKVGLDELKQVAWQISQIFDKKAQKLIREKKVRYGSPTVLKYSDAETEEMTLGDGKVQTTLNRFIPAHDALIGEPAYGKELDVIKAICDGDGPGCALKLMGVSAQVNTDNVDQLTIVPFVKKTLKSNFNHKTLSDMVEYSKKTRQGSTDSCVSRKISILADEHPDWENDQTIAVAYSYCKKDKAGEIEKLILGDLTPEVMKIHDKIRKEANQKEVLVSYVDKAQNKLRAAAEEENWITVKGNHIKIEKGETKSEAVERFLKSKNKGKNVFDTSSYNNNKGKIKVKVAKVLPEWERHIDVMREAWNDLDDSFKSGIDNFNIGDAPGNSFGVGTFDHRTNTIGLHIDNSSLTTESTKEEIKSLVDTTLIHEVAHSKFSTFSNNEKYAWEKAVMKIEPITGYLDKFKVAVDDAKKQFDVIDGRRKKQFEIIDENTKQIREGVSPAKESELRSDTKWREHVIDEDEENYNKTYTKKEQMIGTFANETFSEFQVINQGHKSFYTTNASSFNSIKPIYDKMFGSKK